MSLFTGIVCLLIPSAFGGVFLMRLFARNFLYHEPFWAGILPTIIVTCCLLIIGSLIILKIIRPFDKILKRVKSGGERPSHQEKIQCVATYNKIRLVIFIVHFAGFFAGQVGVALLELALGHTTFNLVFLLTLAFHSLAVAGIFSLLTLYSFDGFFCAPAREILQLQDISRYQKYHQPKVSQSTRTIFYFVLYFTIMNLIFITIGIISSPEYLRRPDLISYYIKSIILAVVISVGIGVIPFITFTHVTSKRIKDTANLVNSTAEQGDLTSRINITMIDDFGTLVSSINTLITKLAQMVIGMKSETNIVSKSASTLADVSDSAVNALGQLKDAFKRIQNEVDTQNNLIDTANEDVENLIEKVEAVQRNIIEQSSSVQQSSAAVSEMIANINSVADLTKKADEVSEQLSKSSAIGNESLKNAIATVTEIQAASEEVQNIIKVIQQIASQTNLLSMNAAIEAAHAGEFGKGFAVVADEVRALAANSSKSAKDIQLHIKNMIDIINSGVVAMNSAGGAFKEIATQVEQNHELTRTIAAAMEEQRSGAEETLKTTTHLVESMNAIKELADGETESANNVKDGMAKVIDSAQQSIEVVNNCISVSNELDQALMQVDENVQENKDAVVAMTENMDVFNI